MPQIKLNIGPMDLESDPSSTKDGVLAHLINGYTVGEAVHMWPGMVEYLDLGTGADVWTYHSTLHNTTLAVSDGRLFRITDTATEITGAVLTAGTPPTFAEDADSIFIAANSVINTYVPGEATASTPREAIAPVYSDVVMVTTSLPTMTLTHLTVQTVTATSFTIRYSVLDADETHFKLEASVNGGAWTEKEADVTPGEHLTVSFTPGVVIPTTYSVKLRITALVGDTVITTPAVKVSLFGNLTPNTPPQFTAQPTVFSVSDTQVVLSYSSVDAQGNHYTLSASTDNGGTYQTLESNVAAGDANSATIDGLEAGTDYRILLRMKALAGNLTTIDSETIKVSTTYPDKTNTPGSPLTFTVQPTASDISSSGVRINYGTADTGGYQYQLEVSKTGGDTFTVQEIAEDPATGLSFLVSGLDYDTSYYFRLKLTSQDSQAPVNVTSLAYLSGFLIANGEAQEGAVPGDFGYSDNAGYTKWSFENNASNPDSLQAIIATPNRELYCIGTQSTDINRLGGSVDNPFEAETSAALAYGTPAPYSICYDQQSIYFISIIGGNRQIVRLVDGRNPQISSFSVDGPLSNIRDISTAQGGLMGFRGQTFYIVNFPDADVTIDDMVFPSLTLAFNIRAERWAILGEWDGGYTRYRGNSFALADDQLYIGGNDGKIYTLGEPAREAEPQFQHRWRNNGRKEWREPRTFSLGRIGDRHVPLRSRLCGRYFKRQDELIFADGPYRMAIRTGWRNWGKNVEKLSTEYVYDVKRGDEGVVFNGIEEVMEPVR